MGDIVELTSSWWPNLSRVSDHLSSASTQQRLNKKVSFVRKALFFFFWLADGRGLIGWCLNRLFFASAEIFHGRFPTKMSVSQWLILYEVESGWLVDDVELSRIRHKLLIWFVIWRCRRWGWLMSNMSGYSRAVPSVLIVPVQVHSTVRKRFRGVRIRTK